MKKLFLLLLALIAVMAMDAKKVVFDFTDPASLGITPSADKSSGVDLSDSTIVVDDITMTCEKLNSTNATKLFTKSDGASYELRTYNQNKITFTSAGDKITAIEFEGSDVNFAEFSGKSWTGEEQAVVLTGTATSKITKATLTVGEAAVVWTPDTVSVTEAIALADAKDAHDHYVIGVVMAAPFITYDNFNGHASFWLSDVANPSDSIELYDGYAQGNAKWASLEAAQEAIHGGDTVLVYAGAVTLYEAMNFYEITGGHFAEMLGANPNPVDPNALEIPEGYITCAAAIELAAGLEDPTADNKTVKGETVKICAAVTYAYVLVDGKQSAWIDDKKSGSGLIQASHLATSAEVAKGDIVLIEGTIAKYFIAGKDGAADKIIIEVVDGTMSKSPFISIIPNNSGTVSVNGNILTAVPNYGYHFVQWSDSVTDNPRIVALTQHHIYIFTAEFAANPRITYHYNSLIGNVSGPSMTETGVAADSITFNASPNYGYHFVKWNDGNEDNPRTIWLSQDTTFTAEFAYDRSGKCGNDLALTWIYDTISRTLTISGNGAFNENMECGVEAKLAMMHLVLEDGITSIGDQAFNDCSGLTSVTIPNSVTSIGYAAFSGCSNLAEVTIGESVTSVGERAFYNCTGVTSVVWNAKNCADFTYENAPFKCYWEWDYYLDKQVEICSHISSFVLGNAVEHIPAYLCYRMRDLTSITIPNSVTSIGDQAFNDCSGLTSVTIPNSVTSIGNSAFSGCSSLTEMIIPSSVAMIGDYVFNGCEKLQRLTILNKDIQPLEEYSYGMFIQSTALKQIKAPAFVFDLHNDYTSYPSYFPQKLDTIEVTNGELSENALWLINLSRKTLKSIDLSGTTHTDLADEAFKEFYNLETLKLPADLTYIGYKSVAECVKLKSIDIPASVEEIGDRAFEDCRSIETITFGGVQPSPAPGRHNALAVSVSQLRRIGNWAFYNAHELQHIEIPEGVTEIGDGAFYGCTYLEDLVLPSSVQSIGDNCFALCSKLTKIIVNSTTPPEIQAKTFYDVKRQIPVYVPDDCVDAYKGDQYWGEFNIIGQSENPQAIENAMEGQTNGKSMKIFRNGQILILRGDKTYTVTGVEVQ